MASLARPITSRAVHLRITPRPSTLGESREILRLITEFGEVEYFKNLKYDALSAPNTSLVIFRDEDAATNCMRRSPIRFRMGRAVAPVEEEEEAVNVPEQASPAITAQQPMTQSPPRPAGSAGGGAWGLGQTRSMSTIHNSASSSYTPISIPKPPARPVQQPFQPPPLPILDDSRIFQISTNPARIHFRDHINTGHYHGSFAIDTKSVPQTYLAESVPPAQLGMSCVNWKKPDKPWRYMNSQKQSEREGPNRRRSLRELFDGAERGKEGVVRDTALPI